MAVIAETRWTPAPHGVLTSRQAINGEISGITIRHHMSPFKGASELSGQSAIDEPVLRQLALNYLVEVDRSKVIGLPKEWLDSLSTPTDDATFGWLPIAWPVEAGPEQVDNAGDPFVSFRIGRKINGSTTYQTVMLLAGERLAGKFIGSGFGICVVTDLRPSGQDKFEAQIVGFSASLPYGRYLNGLSREALAQDGIAQQDLLDASVSPDVKRQIGSLLGLESLTIRGTRYFKDNKDEWKIERHGSGQERSASGNAATYSFVLSGTATGAGGLVSKELLQADADAQIFTVDPESQDTPEQQGTNVGFTGRRASRTDAELYPYLATTQLPTPLQFYESGNELMRVVPCPDFVRADKLVGGGLPKSVNLTAGSPPVHSDDFSAISAFYNVKQVLDRMIAYGLDPFDYFRFAGLPLHVAYRSGMQAGPGKDGEIVNACVKVGDWPFDYIGPTPIGARPTVEMRLALADLTRRARKPWDQINRAVAEPFGIAADDRWIWHEACHVLLVAAVGELEFRFAHSAGDALAAIALDPVSKLAQADTHGGSYWRGMTFPWVFTPRRHDRSVTDGWSWGGTMHSDLAAVTDSTPPRRKGYLSEQILSSSLFRLYRILGGDTFEEDDVRRAASHYCLNLIMDAIRRLGSGAIVSLHNDPEQFVCALLDSDAATPEWLITFPATGGSNYRRVGGCAYKAIRWAFEAQGLYSPAGAISNAPGLPPSVDVYVANGRASATTDGGQVAYGKGSYAPVSLHWDLAQNGNEPSLPAWQAAPGAVQVQADGIHVAVGNRGSDTAHNVQVSVFWIVWPLNQPAPVWNSAGWTQSPSTAAKDIPIGAGEVNFGPIGFAPPAPGRYVLVAKASCADDPAIPDVTDFACSSMPTKLVDLVTGDNNLGLRVVTVA